MGVTASSSLAELKVVTTISDLGRIAEAVGGDDVIFVGCYAGQFFPVNVLQVFDTGTTAGEIVALW